MAKKIKISMEARELENADVAFISLVNRPANRIPFRVTKSDPMEDDDMSINMSGPKKVQKRDSAPIASAIGALVIKSEHVEELKPALEDAGFSMFDGVENEGVTVFKQADYVEDDTVPMQISDDVTVLVTQKANFEPYPESMDFGENLKSSGFMPSVYQATDVMVDTIRNVLYKSDSMDEAATNIRVVLKDFTKYVGNLADNVPLTVFKLDEVLNTKKEEEDPAPTGDAEGDPKAEDKSADAVAKKGDEGDAGDEGTDADTGGDAGDTGDEAVAKKGDEEITEAVAGDLAEGVKNAKKEDSGTTEAEANAGDGDEAAAAAVAKDEDNKGGDDPMATVLNAINAMKTDLTQAIGDVQKDVESVKKDSGELQSRLDNIEKVAKSADQAVRGTVLQGSEDGDGDLDIQTEVKKSDDPWAGVNLPC